MTSRRQVASNRNNAQRSTGPKTAAGKQAVAGNARRHGLSGRLAEGSDALRQADRLALTILENGKFGPEAETAAQAYAEAQVKLDLIRQQRQICIDAILQSKSDEVAEAGDAGAKSQEPLDLAKLARYERMARAERRAAVEQLDRLKRG